MLQRSPKDRRAGAGRAFALLVLALLLAVGLGGFLGSAADSADTIREDLSAGDDLQPIRLMADTIIQGQANGESVYLMRGKVWIEQGLVSLRLEEAVVWVSDDSQRKTGTCIVEVYGEGSASIPATLQKDGKRQKAPRAMLRLSSRLLVKMDNFVGKIQQGDPLGDTLFGRATAARAEGMAEPRGTRLGPVPAIRMSSGEEPVLPPTQIGLPPSLPVLPSDPAPSLPAPPSPSSPAALPGPPATLPVPEIGSPLAAPPGPPQALPQVSSSQPVGQTPLPPPSTSLSPDPHGGGGVLPPLAPPAASPFDAKPKPKSPDGAIPGPPVTEVPEEGPPRQLFVRPRNALPIQADKRPIGNGEYAIVITTPIILTVVSVKEKKVLVDIEADRMVMWGKQDDPNDPLHNMSGPQGSTTKKMEFYLAGNVEIRTQTTKESQILRCQEAYYDVGRNVALARQADLEVKTAKLINPTHFKAEELRQLGPKLFDGKRVELFSTVLPADPGLKIELTDAQLERTDQPRRSIFGKVFIDMKTGQPVTTPESIITGNNAVMVLEGVPIFYYPWIKTEANDPLGPLDSIGFGYSNIFGAQFYTTWNVFDLIGVVPTPGMKWQMTADYMSARGPALGTWYNDTGKNLFGITNQYELNFKAWGLDDHGNDILGGIGQGRGQQAWISPTTFLPVDQPELRGRLLAQANILDLDYGFTVQGELALLTDRNVLEQYYNSEWNNNLNQETFAYVKQQQNNWAWTILGEDRLRSWITETNWLPKVDGYLLGANIFDWVLYNTHASAGYGQLRPANTEPPEYIPTEVSKSTGRLDWWQEFNTFFNVGDMKVVPYAILDLTYYSDDIAGNQVGRVYGAGGVRASIPFSRLFPDIKSELFNLNGIFHKITLSGNYYYAQTNVHYNQLPQLDQINDDPTNQALRDIYPVQPLLNPANAVNLMNNKLFDPQYYALQRLVDNRVDSLDDIDVLQLDLRQRWQTKRGIPGEEHVVDWMILDLQASIYPQPNRDNNSNQPVGFLGYDWIWNIGDRTAIFSNGWADPVSGGPHFFTMGATITRPDRTSFTLSYRQIDPLESKAVIGSVILPLSAKYAITGSTMYDFGVHTQVNTVMLTRIGTDLRFSIGFSYNSILQNFNAVVEIVPNISPNSGRGGGLGTSAGGLGSATGSPVAPPTGS